VILVGLFTAQDFSRSMTMIWPLALYGLIRFAKVAPAWNRWTLSLGAAGALLLPAHHVMSDRVCPIYYLHHELALLKEPPEGASPNLWELVAIRAIEEGDPAAAEVALSVAVKLSEHPANIHRRRGMLRARQGHWREAQQDYSKMTQDEPGNPDAWFLLAQSEFALGNTIAAREKMQQALRLPPIDFVRRQDVSRFLEELNPKTGAVEEGKTKASNETTHP
jgi:tetratricopeptide (TPR) repeat protein